MLSPINSKLARSRFRRSLLTSLVVLVPLGIATKLYQGPGAKWSHGFAGAVLYEIFWILFVVWLWPRTSPMKVVLGVLAATVAIEFLQLWHPSWLTAIRETLVGKALLGTTFSPWDFPYYVLGCGLGWGWLHGLAKWSGFKVDTSDKDRKIPGCDSKS